MASVIVGVIAIVVSVAVYYLGRHHGRQEREHDRRQQRIDAFVSDYVDRARRNIIAGIAALVPAGVFRLRDDKEIREALDTCALQLGKHPLGKEVEKLERVDLKVFFDYAAREKVDFMEIPVESVIERLPRNRGH